MNAQQAAGFALGAAVGALAAAVLLRVALRIAPRSLMRDNVGGRKVPAVLGLPLVAGGVLGLGVVYVVDANTGYSFTTRDAALALLLVLVVASLSGFVDDRRGNESARGFAGHLRAALRGRITGGLVKIVGIGAAGLGAGLLVAESWRVVEVAVLVALSANLLNLLDRAPGRAAKVALATALPLVGFGAAAWATAAGGMAGAALICLVPDLREQGMLGDAGANALGAALGLGLALALDGPARLIALALLIGLNLASERWSFSRGIERVGWLRALDDLGRTRASGVARKEGD